jgi:uncharacterized protein
MTLIDAGPLIALVDKSDKENHRKCVAAFQACQTPPLTTWPCVAEAMYLLGQINGWPAQQMLWGLLLGGAVDIHHSTEREIERIAGLMEQYRDVPMDLADASLVALAELRNIHRILTLDRDFFIYRINGKHSFEVIQL